MKSKASIYNSLHNTCYRTLAFCGLSEWAQHPLHRTAVATEVSQYPGVENTMAGWKSVPAIRVAMAIRSRCP